MKLRHIILLLMKYVGGCIETKTKLQKMLYFLSLLLGKDFRFRPHYYGPYSFMVEQGLSELVGAGFVSVKSEVFGIDTESGFPVKRYEYEITEAGQRLVAKLARSHDTETAEVKASVENLKSIGCLDYMSLATVAKAHFLLGGGKTLTASDVVERARGFGWTVRPEQVEGAVKTLGELGLLK